MKNDTVMMLESKIRQMDAAAEDGDKRARSLISEAEEARTAADRARAIAADLRALLGEKP